MSGHGNICWDSRGFQRIGVESDLRIRALCAVHLLPLHHFLARDIFKTEIGYRAKVQAKEKKVGGPAMHFHCLRYESWWSAPCPSKRCPQVPTASPGYQKVSMWQNIQFLLRVAKKSTNIYQDIAGYIRRLCRRLISGERINHLSLHGVPKHLLAGVHPGLAWSTKSGISRNRKTTRAEKQHYKLYRPVAGFGILDFCLSVGKGKGWSGEGSWFGAGIMFVGSTWWVFMKRKPKQWLPDLLAILRHRHQDLPPSSWIQHWTFRHLQVYRFNSLCVMEYRGPLMILAINRCNKYKEKYARNLEVAD